MFGRFLAIFGKSDPSDSLAGAIRNKVLRKISFSGRRTIFGPFFVDFATILAPFWAPKRRKVSFGTLPKKASNFDPRFFQFFADFGTPQNPKKEAKKCAKKKLEPFFWRSVGLPPFFFAKNNKTAPKMTPDRQKIKILQYLLAKTLLFALETPPRTP